ncbi:MAG: glycoside hydrolase, partial [Muribaculaceae bacterium]|nr:glycoside hydrolase [Muribaculaceae bacterium]
TCTDAEQGGKENVEDVAVVTPTRVYAAGLYPNMECELTLRMQVSEGGICRFSYSLDGTVFNTIKQTFKARAGKWIGAKAGFYSITPAKINDRGWMDVMDCDIKLK